MSLSGIGVNWQERHQFGRLDFKGSGEALQGFKPDRAMTSFDQAYMGTVNPGKISKLLLRQSLCSASRFQSFAEPFGKFAFDHSIAQSIAGG